ncbi:AAA family ATPase [Heliobacterium chlorum]|uniref:AAA family ATPase n=1 Tax=Heliobacterium chlorum TaxID=2698 RepID=A0ABR7T567_HELCL|nr:DnaB-like helicase C-terminal domain-containing protein [Heliobacterium chlorum]MBC9785913.1 AAA family ATPase [Heliobacterium chlorum]
MLESQLISKAIDENAFHQLYLYNIDGDDFPTMGKVYAFIRDYVKENGKAPDPRTVAAEFEEFDYMPGVADTFKFLCTRLKAQTTKRQAFELLQNQAGKKFSDLPGDKFISWLKEETSRIETLTASTFSLGTNYAANGNERREWYEEAKTARDSVFIPTPYASLTEALAGGLETGDFILLMAFTNRGKSWIASHIGLTAWENRFPVLHYSPELSKKQQSLRLDTLMGKFDNVKLRRGQLDSEEAYFGYLDAFSPEIAEAQGAYVIKTMEDLPGGLTIEAIEADLQTYPDTKMVIIDGFNLMIHGKGRGMRDAMTATSRRLRQLFGRYGVAGLVVHQTPGAAEKEGLKQDDDGNRIIKPPKLTDYSETIAVIQDAATVLTFDAADGIGKISIEKCREPNVGKVVELSVNFNLGHIRETDVTDLF